MNKTDMLDWRKKPDESSADYIGRLGSVKEELGFTWEDLAIIFNDELNLDLSERSYRRRYNDWVKGHFDDSVDDDIAEELYTIKKERIKLRDELSQINNNIRLEAREEHMREMAIEAATEAAKIKTLPTPDEIPVVKVPNKKKGIIAVGDWHYGIDVNVFYNVYNPQICRNRVKKLALKCLDIIEKENLNEVYIINLGDMISGRIHLPLRINTRQDVVSQTMNVSELLAEFLSFLSEFVKINYGSVLDNHSRVEPKKKESLQTESFARIIDWYLRERLMKNKNISFINNSYGDDICLFEVFDHTITGVHGDKDKVNKVITSLNTYIQSHIDLILTAHMHHFSADESNETVRLCTGSLMGADEYASDLRLNSKPSQLFIVATEDNITECIYKMNIV